MNERSCECLLPTTTGYPKETFLDAGVGRAHNNFVTLSNYIFNRPCLVDRTNFLKQLTNPVRSREKPWWTTVHPPSRGSHLADLLDFLIVDEFKPPSSHYFVVLDGRHRYSSSTLD
jgi:hypothetical protein